MNPKDIFTLCFVLFVVLSSAVIALLCRRAARRGRERLHKRINDSKPNMFL